MSASADAQQQLLDTLAGLVQGDNFSAYLCSSTRSGFRITSATSTGALLALPMQGRKRAREGAEWVQVVPGSMFLVPNARSMDIEHVPDPASGMYVAVILSLDEAVLGAARNLLGATGIARNSGIAAVPIGEHAAGLLRWCQAIREGDLAGARYALVGVVLSLLALGHHGLLKPAPPTLSLQVRAMIAAEPARNWSSPDIEDALNISGATLRRRLLAEGSGLRDILTEARLAHALALLQSTRLPVKSIAGRAGYASVSSFIKRFSARYGVEPSRVSAL